MKQTTYISPEVSRVTPIRLNNDPEFYQRRLSNSYFDYIFRNGQFRRISLNGRIYKVREANPDDISNIVLRDGQLGSLFIGDKSTIRRLTATAERPDYPIGFFLARKHQERPQTLEIFYHYVSPDYRWQGVGSAERGDILHSALGMVDIDNVLAVRRQKSDFYESLDGICSSFKKSGLWYHKINLSDKEKAREIIVNRLRDLGVELIR